MAILKDPILNIFTTFLVISFSGGTSAYGAPRENLASDIKERLVVDTFAATNWIESLGSPQEVCDLYDLAVRDLYWLDKGAKSLSLIGPLGIHYCLISARNSKLTNPQLALDLIAQAKTIAYNVAVNSWPGWGDEGVVISPQEIQIGLDAAKTNLRFALELHKPRDKVASAYWLLGALQMAANRYSDALLSLENATKLSIGSEDKAVPSFYWGFQGVIELAAEKSTGDKLFTDGIFELQKLNTEDAKAYIQQLKTARRVFVR